MDFKDISPEKWLISGLIAILTGLGAWLKINFTLTTKDPNKTKITKQEELENRLNALCESIELESGQSQRDNASIARSIIAQQYSVEQLIKQTEELAINMKRLEVLQIEHMLQTQNNRIMEEKVKK